MDVCNCAQTLPDVQIYGGDTEPWQLILCHDNGAPYKEAELTNCLISLDVLALTNRVYSDSRDTDRIALSKSGRLMAMADGSMTAIFDLIEDDTINMRGSYIYQVTMTISGVSHRVCQGRLTVIPNVKRGVLLL